MLSQAVGYAASALGLLAGSGQDRMLVREMAIGVRVPGPYLAKIVRQLALRGIVHTQKGIGGGVSLSRPADQISLFDLCTALDDPVVEKRCMLGTAECSDDRACPAHPFWTVERDRQLSFLHQTTLHDMAAFESRRVVELA
jgi:Rrf2 family protein